MAEIVFSLILGLSPSEVNSVPKIYTEFKSAKTLYPP